MRSLKIPYFFIILSAFAACIILLILKFFFIDIAVVNSQAMLNTLPPGARVWVRPYMFLSPSLEQNDIVLLELPLSVVDTAIPSDQLFKRIVALPGDTVLIRASRVYINDRELEINSSFLHNYVIKVASQKDTALLQEAGITDKYLVDDSCAYITALTAGQYEEIKNKYPALAIKENREDSGLYDEEIFPGDKKIKWNKDFYGPLYIPKRGDTLVLDSTSIKIYGRIVYDFEQSSISVDTMPVKYIVKRNYYFVVGDNFDSSVDSRQWGFIPGSRIKAVLLFK